MGAIVTCLAVVSLCAFAYIAPIVWVIVTARRHRDKTEVIQEYDVDD